MSERSEIYGKIKERGLEKDFKWPGFDIDEAKARIKKYDLFEAEETKEEAINVPEEPELSDKGAEQFIEDVEASVEPMPQEEMDDPENAVDEEPEEAPVEELDEAELICDNCGDSFVPDDTPYECSFGHIQCQACGDVCKTCPAEEEPIWHFIDKDGCPCGANNDNNDLSATPEIDDVTCDECLVIIENNDAEKVEVIPACFGEKFDGHSEKCGSCDIKLAMECETQTGEKADEENLLRAIKENKTVEEIESEDESEEQVENPPVKIPKKAPKRKIIPKKRRYFKKPKKKSDNPYDIAKNLMK